MAESAFRRIAGPCPTKGGRLCYVRLKPCARACRNGTRCADLLDQGDPAATYMQRLDAEVRAGKPLRLPGNEITS